MKNKYKDGAWLQKYVRKLRTNAHHFVQIIIKYVKNAYIFQKNTQMEKVWSYISRINIPKIPIVYFPKKKAEKYASREKQVYLKNTAYE